MEGDLTTADLLEAWRDATRAAELAERLATVALKAAERADASALASEDIATLAESAAEAATQAADTARRAATKAREIASGLTDFDLADADEAVVTARETEARAANRYHAAEQEARRRHGLATTDGTAASS